MNLKNFRFLLFAEIVSSSGLSAWFLILKIYFSTRDLIISSACGGQILFFSFLFLSKLYNAVRDY